MKARKQAQASSSQEPPTLKVTPAEGEEVVDYDEDINSGFGSWLRSADGIGYMRLFVVANSLVVFMTVSWPQISHALEIVGEYFAGWN